MNTQSKTSKKIAKKQRLNENQSPRIMSSMQVFSGPIPPASELLKYEQVLPGAAERIMSMAERQSIHRQGMEDKMLDANIKSEKRGQFFGFTVFITVILIGFVLLIFDKKIEGLASILGSIAGVIGLFIYSREDTKRELQKKDPLESH